MMQSLLLLICWLTPALAVAAPSGREIMERVDARDDGDRADLDAGDFTVRKLEAGL
jgi:hypothetical protein